MSQHDYIIDNQDGASFRGDINNVLAAIVSNNSGATAPATTYAGQFWFDTSTNILKQRNAGNTAWVTLADAILSGQTVAGNVAFSGAITAGKLISGTAVNSTSGTAIDFTGIPSWVKRVTVMFNQVSTSATSPLIIQLGNAGSLQTTGYTGYATAINGGTGQTSSSIGHIINQSVAGAVTQSGSVTFVQLSSTSYVYVGTGMVLYDGAAGAMAFSASRSSYTSAIDRLRITTVNGTDTFDAGAVNIIYE